MKKIFIYILISFFSVFQAVFADSAFQYANPSYTNFTPYYTNSVNHYGIGAARVTNFIEIYEKPDLNSKVLQRIYWNNIGNFVVSNKTKMQKPSDIFILYSPKENMVFLSVEDEDDDWINVCFDQKNLKFGWVKKENGKHGAKFYSYKDLFFEFGKKHGIYTFRNLPADFKTLHSSPSIESNVVDEFDYPKFITPWLIQGNWMLVKVVTMNNETKTGWFHWRSDNGRLYGFINAQ